jgi:hypothetical protein
MIIQNDTHPGDTDEMPSSILKNGKLKPGIYQIQNLAGQTYVEIQESERQLCGRPATVLSTGDGVVRSARILNCRRYRLSDMMTLLRCVPDELDDL